MKILIIQVGNYTPHDQIDRNTTYLEYETLLHGRQLFDQKQIINNVQTRQSIEIQNVEVHYFFHTDRKSIYGLLASSLRIRKLSKEINPDLTHIYWGGLSGLLAILFCRGKTVISLLGSDLYGSYSQSGRPIFSSRIQQLASQLCVFFSTGAIVMSNRMRNLLWKSLQKKVRVIPEGISLRKFKPMDCAVARKYLKWPANKLIIIFFYEGQPVKNFKLFKDSFECLKLRMPECEYKIIKGYKHEDLVYVYNAADLLVITSLHEGSNNSIKEAMACNLPVVSVPCGDSEERLNQVKNCFVAETYDKFELANLMERVLKNGYRSNGINYTAPILLSNTSKETVNFYFEILSR